MRYFRLLRLYAMTWVRVLLIAIASTVAPASSWSGTGQEQTKSITSARLSAAASNPSAASRVELGLTPANRSYVSVSVHDSGRSLVAIPLKERHRSAGRQAVS